MFRTVQKSLYVIAKSNCIVHSTCNFFFNAQKQNSERDRLWLYYCRLFIMWQKLQLQLPRLPYIRFVTLPWVIQSLLSNSGDVIKLSGVEGATGPSRCLLHPSSCYHPPTYVAKSWLEQLRRALFTIYSTGTFL